MAFIEINHPQGSVPPFFVAQGIKPANFHAVQAFIVKDDFSQFIVGEPLPGNATTWGMVFTGVPPGNWVLVVFDWLHAFQSVVIQRFTVVPAGAELTIHWPDDGVPMVTPFWTYGSSEATIATATMTDSQGRIFTGAVVFEMGGSWAVRFDISPPCDNDFTLYVEDSAGDSESRTGISINSCS